MRQNDVFPSNFLKSADLNGKAVRVTIASCDMEDLGDDRKPVLRFAGKDKGMVVNKTNWGILEAATGQPDSDDWAGYSIVIYATKVSYQGKMVDGLRVDDRPGAVKAPAKPVRKSAPPVDEFPDVDDNTPVIDDDSIPF